MVVCTLHPNQPPNPPPPKNIKKSPFSFEFLRKVSNAGEDGYVTYT